MCGNIESTPSILTVIEGSKELFMLNFIEVKEEGRGSTDQGRGKA